MQNKTRRLTVNAMLAALSFVLSYIALDMQVVKITFESFPVHVGALLLGPASGGTIALIATALFQLLRHGITPTTLLWMAPNIISGLGLGMYAKTKKFQLTRKQMVIAVLIAEIVITTVNTFALYVDGNMFGWYKPDVFLAALPVRYAICLVKGVAYGYILHPVVVKLQKTVLK